MFYNSGQAYTRGLLTDRGDECEYFSVSPGVLAAIAEEFDPSVGDRPLAPFRFPNGPTDAVSYLRQRQLFQYVASTDSADQLLVQEEFFDILRNVFATAFRIRDSITHPRSPTTLRAHADAADATKELLGRCYHDRLLLEDIAESVHVSPYHLCRIFRTHTGYSLHAYIEHLRLRQALESLADKSIDLTTLALDLGYSSHAHFTRAFRRLFGLTPSAARDRGALSRLRQKQARL
jgi:AraC-like DNA-binding protein